MKLVQSGIANNFGLVGKNIRKYLATTALTATGLLAVSSPALADNWTDHVASEGSISIDTGTPNTTNITQHTDFTKVHGDGDINAGWTVNIAQPNKKSKYVLYDVENDPTMIMGTLNANGRVYIFDQNGVVFGENSQVNVGGIVTSTGFISDADIKADKHVFQDVGGNGSIVNNGTITAAEGGLAAFVAPSVVNNGIIEANVVAVGSGNKVAIDLYGDNLVNIEVDGALENAIIENKGTIKASGGTVALTVAAAKDAVDSVINMDGVIDVSSTSGKGGKIAINGGAKGVVHINGTMNANGTDGGDISVVGENILAGDTSVASADGTGNGGTVEYIAEKGLIYGGSTSAKGGTGTGGFVDTSGHDWVDIYGTVDVSAFSGSHGTWLIDPSNLTISDSSATNVGGTGSQASPFAPDGDTISVLRNTSIQNALNTGANVYITTVGTPNKVLQDGTININANITKSSGAESTLNFEAAGGIILQNGKTIGTSNGSVLNVNMHALGSNILVNGIVINGAIKTNGGDVNLDADNGNMKVGGTGLIQTTGGSVTLNADVGNVEIESGGKIESGGGNINTTANFLLPTGLGGTPFTGGTIVNGIVDAQGGNIKMEQSGMFKGAANSVRTSGTGTIELNQNNLLGLGGSTIQNAIDAIQNTGTGTNTVKVGVGTWKESVEANVDNLVLKGAWAGITPAIRLIELLETVIDPNSPGIHVTADNVVVDGFTITGATGADGYGVWVDGAANTVVTNNIIHDNDSHGVLVNNGSSNTNINNNRIYNLGTGPDTADGIRVQNSTGVDISWNVIDSLFGNGVLVSLSGGPIDVHHNFIGLLSGTDKIWGDGVEIDGVNGNARVSSNVITNTWDPTKDNTNDNSSGVYVRNSNNVVVGGPGLLDGNLIYGVDWDGVKVKGGTGNLVQHNIISDTTRIGVYGEGTFGLTIDQNSVTNANLDYFGGITVLGGEDHTISGNFVTGPASGADSGIYLGLVTGGDNKIVGNIIHDVKGTGIDVTNVTNVDIGLNSVTKTSRVENNGNGDGIRVRDSFGDINIVANLVGDILGFSDIEGDGISVSNVDGVNIKSNVIYNTTASNPIDGDDASGIYLINVKNAQVGGPSLLDGNFIRNADWDGVKIKGGSNNTVQGNNIAHSTRIGIYGEGTDEATVLNNIVHDSNLAYWGGITLLGGGDHEIGGNLVTNDDTSTGHHGIVLGLSDGDSSIHNNIVYNFSHNGVYVFNTTGSVSVDENLIGTVDNGIYASSVEGLSITQNAIDGRFLVGGKGSNGIYVEDSYNAQIGGGFLQGNYVEDFATGIRVIDSESADVESNIVTSFVDYGVNVSDSNYVDVKKNVIFDGDGTGVRVDNSHNAEINQNVITNVDGHGIELVDSHNVDILANIVNNVGKHGIFVDPSDFVDIGFNIVNNAAWDGIHVDGGNWADIFFNVINDSGYDGIDVDDNDGVDITFNVVNNSGDNGIEVDDSYNAGIAFNVVNDSDNDGIHVEDSFGADIRNNVVNNSDEDGIDVDDSGYVDIVGNVVNDSGDNGIEVSDSYNADIQFNIVNNSGDDGVEVDDSNRADIRWNVINNSGDDGIDLDSSSNVDIVGNYVDDSGDNGIVADDSWNVNISWNRVDDSNGDGIEVTDSNWADINWNKVTDSGDDGIDVDDSFAVDIIGNDIEDTGYNGIEVTNSDFADIKWNDITGAGLDGINLYNADWADIENNDIYGESVWAFGIGKAGAKRDGIHVVNSYNVDIIDNRITGGDAGFFALGGAGAGRDGIYVYNSDWSDIRGNEITAGNGGFFALGGVGAGDDGIDVRNSFATDIYDNLVDGVFGDGIQVRNSNYADVIGNRIRNAGDDGIDIEDSANVDVNYNRVRNVVNNGIEADDAYNIDIIGNRVRNVGDNGIYVDDSNRADIRNNRIRNTGDDGIHVDSSNWVDIDGNRVRNAGDDGIDVEDSNFLSITDNNVRFSDENGIEVENGNFIYIDGNTSNDNGEAGIFVDPSNFIMISNNTTNSNKFGIFLDWVKGVIVTGNTVEDNKIGLYAHGKHNGYIRVSDNMFVDNKIGAKFESGIIDLTGPGNTFLNGEIGLYFAVDGRDPTKLSLVRSGGFFGGGYTYDGQPNDTWPTTAVPTNFGGTIGNQTFKGQTESFVRLGRNTFVDPVTGEAIWLDATDSTYWNPAENAYFTPSIDGLTADRLAFLESMFHHRPDANNRGIFFFGIVPPEVEDLADIDQSLIFNRFNAFNGDLTGLNVRILSLPSIGGGQGGAGAGGGAGSFVLGSTDPNSLNQIATAAGGEGQPSAASLNEIDTAAGGGTDELCWGNAVAAVSGGQVTNVVYNGTFASNLNQAAACGTGF